MKIKKIAENLALILYNAYRKSPCAHGFSGERVFENLKSIDGLNELEINDFEATLYYLLSKDILTLSYVPGDVSSMFIKVYPIL